MADSLSMSLHAQARMGRPTLWDLRNQVLALGGQGEKNVEDACARVSVFASLFVSRTGFFRHAGQFRQGSAKIVQ